MKNRYVVFSSQRTERCVALRSLVFLAGQIDIAQQSIPEALVFRPPLRFLSIFAVEEKRQDKAPKVL